jgi:hypothetical protein
MSDRQPPSVALVLTAALLALAAGIVAVVVALLLAVEIL